MTTCNVKGVDDPTESEHPVLCRDFLLLFSAHLFWFSSPQMYGVGSLSHYRPSVELTVHSLLSTEQQTDTVTDQLDNILRLSAALRESEILSLGVGRDQKQSSKE